MATGTIGPGPALARGRRPPGGRPETGETGIRLDDRPAPPPADVRPAGLRRPLLLLLAAVAVLALAYVAAVWSGLAGFVADEQGLRRWFASLGVAGPLIVIGLEAFAVVLSPLPSAPIAMAAGAVYGSVLGTVYTVIGAEIGSVTAFLIARVVGFDLVRRWVPRGGIFDRLEHEKSQTWLMAIVFASRLVPFLSFDAVSYAAGLTPLAFWRFAIATLLGVIPIAFLLAHVGSDLIEGGSPLAIVILVTLAITSAAPFVWGGVRRLSRRSGGDDAGPGSGSAQ